MCQEQTVRDSNFHGQGQILRLQTDSFSMQYDKGKHTIYHHRDHLVWITKYRQKVLTGAIRERVREVARQVTSNLPTAKL